MHINKKYISLFYDAFFYGSIIFLAYTSLSLVFHLPFYAHYGGPDEPMHRSMSEYIAKHLSWPHWDSTELLRYSNGTSYSNGSSVVYWLHGITFKLSGMHRLGSFLLFIIYLAIAGRFYQKRKIAGLLSLVCITPQALFVFSYVNSDVGTIMIAFLFGISIARFVTYTESRLNLMLFFIMAGTCIAARQHLWVLGFIAFAYTLFLCRKKILIHPKKDLFLAFVLAVIIASWWPITSCVANDGDLLGRSIDKKAIALFGDPNRPSWAKDWAYFNFRAFFSSVSRSFYGMWGWMRVKLSEGNYIIALSLFMILFSMIFVSQRKLLPFFIFLLLVNVSLMIIYSTQYDYQAQGRYLFPSYFLIAGIALSNMANNFQEIRNKYFHHTLKVLSVAFIALNIYCITLLKHGVLNPSIIK